MQQSVSHALSPGRQFTLVSGASEAAQGRCPRRAIMRGSRERRRREELMALKIYGIPRSRAFRTVWMAKELGLDYENVPIGTGGEESRTPQFLAINPNGHIPAIDDDGFIVWESMAINLYLAKKHSP